jgi:hypothetical protein
VRPGRAGCGRGQDGAAPSGVMADGRGRSRRRGGAEGTGRDHEDEDEDEDAKTGR